MIFVSAGHLAGEPIRQPARFGSASPLPKWVARFRATGSVAPGKVGGHRPWQLVHRPSVRRRICSTGFGTCWAAIVVSRDTIWRFLRREGLSFKKNSVRD